MGAAHAPRTARLVALVGLAAAVLGACGGSSAGSSITGVQFTAADGSKTSIAAFHGTPVIVNLWATWCTPCVKEMPAFDEVAAGESSVKIIGVNVGDTAEAAKAFATNLGVRYPQFTDPDGLLSTALKVTGYPATAFFDADGKLLSVHQGAFTASELSAAIARLYPGIVTKGTSS